MTAFTNTHPHPVIDHSGPAPGGFGQSLGGYGAMGAMNNTTRKALGTLLSAAARSSGAGQNRQLQVAARQLGFATGVSPGMGARPSLAAMSRAFQRPVTYSPRPGNPGLNTPTRPFPPSFPR